MIVDLVSGQQGQQEAEVTALVVEEKVKALKAINVRKQEIRSYEVSLWTLQDEFITVLKWSNAEHKGRVEKPILTLNIDGTEKFECSIPMYIYHEGKRIENPNWYNTRNGALITDLRKLKVILNKATSDEAVFEFVIVQIEETHENEVLTCNITAEGLAFHELGKVGYKINLSQEMFLDEYNKWAASKVGDEPKSNIQYWLSKMDLEDHFERASKWYYEVTMDWSSFEYGATRDNHTIYEERFVSSWIWNNVNHTRLVPGAIEALKEKERPIKVETSNLYNITQTLAETFEVFCRYEYGHDDNYHINSRKIVFYNNFLQEEDQTFSLIYPYSSSAVSRAMDSTSLTTKLFVLDVDNDMMLDGYNTIMNSGANLTKEDYILNFDYLYQTKGITQEQYDAIGNYEKNIREINDALIPIMNEINKYELKKVDVEAKKVFYNNAKDLANERLGQNEEYIKALDIKDGKADGMVDVPAANPEYSKIIVDKENGNYISLAFSNKGIQTDTMHIYREYDFTNHVPDDNSEISKNEYSYEFDEYGFPTKIINVNPITDNEGNITNDSAYLIYSYRPRSYYEAIAKVWEKQLYENEINYNEQSDLLTEIETQLEEKNVLKEQKLNEKKELIHNFEYLMGPALREGYWQPENYIDYGTAKHANLVSPTSYTAATSAECEFIWDKSKPLDGEDNIYYRSGLSENDKTYYPCIDLTNIYDNIKDHIMDYSFIFNNNYVNSEADLNNICNICSFKIGSQALLAFAKRASNNTLRPILILVGAQMMSDKNDPTHHVVNEIAFMKNVNKGHPKLGIITSTYDSENDEVVTEIDENSIQLIESSMWLNTNSYEYEIVYPRIKFNILDLKTDDENLVIHYGNTLLKQYYDYYITTRIQNGSVEYLVTLKPETLLKSGVWNNQAITVDYVLSNVNTAIYLDALKVSKENAWPKVSYEVTPNILNHDLIRILYKKLAHLVMINDTDLKFHNVFGYISEVKLDLDDVTKDNIEVKNYKNKFEDLFSSIIAETEAMRQAGNAFNDALAGNVPLSGDALSNIVQSNVTTNILNAYLDSYFDTSEVVKDRLASLFTEASVILGNANQSLNKIQGLTLENANILSGFVQNVAEELSSKVYRSPTKPVGFKFGDIWIQTDPNDPNKVLGRYMATSNYDDLSGDSSNSTAGFVRTYDGTLASITGAGLNVNADDGIVDIKAANEINIKSGKNVYIAANDIVEIVGNNKVNIGGTQINLCSLQEKKLNPITNEFELQYNEHDDQPIIHETTGINLIAGEYQENSDNYDAQTARVLISPAKIEMGASELELKAASKINLITSSGDTNNTSAVHISSDDGIWIGTGAQQGVRLFSREIALNENGTVDTTTTSVSGASVELTHEHLILGFANIKPNENNATVIEMTDKQIILAAGETIDTGTNASGNSVDNINNTEFKISTSNLSGVQITKDYIGMAVGNGANRSILSIRPGITILGQVTLGGNNSEFVNALPQNKNTSKTYFIENIQGGYTKWYYANSAWTSAVSTPEDFTGSYLWLSNSEVYIGALGNLTLNTNNIKLQTKLLTNGTASPNAAFNDTNTVSQMGFVLGKNLQGVKDPSQAATGNNIATPEPAFAFWMDSSGGKHLIVDADVVQLGHGSAIDPTTLSETIPIESIRIYRLYTSNSTLPSSQLPTGYQWKQLSTIDLTNTGDSNKNWTINLPSPDNKDEGTNKYVWSTTQYKYKIGNEDKYKAIDPVCEGLIDQLTQTSYKEYKYFESKIQGTTSTETAELQAAALAETTGWTINIPSDNNYHISYYYVSGSTNKLCSVGEEITDDTTETTLSNSGLTASDYIYTIRQVTVNNKTVKYTTINTSGVTTTRTKICKQGDWFYVARVNVNNVYQYYWDPTSNIHARTSSNYLYSRIHVIKNNNTTFNKELKLEQELSNMSIAARDAWNIANGTIAVPSVSSSGLSINGNNVVLGSTGNLMLLGNSSIFIGTDSSNSALKMNKSGISIGTQASIGITAGDIAGGITINVVDSNNSIVSGIVMNKTNGFKVTSNVAINMDSPNFKVSSTATDTTRMFYVGESMPPAFSASSAYSIGDRVMRSNNFYEFTSAKAAGAAWNSSAVKSIKIPSISYSLTNGLVIVGNITATSGTFTGTVNARELHVGDGNSDQMSYTSSGGLTIGSSNNLLTYNNGVLSIKGNITATSGTFTGTINATALNVGQTGSTMLMTYDSTNGLKIGGDKMTFNGSDLVIKGNIYANNLYLKQGNTYNTALDSNGNILSSMIILDDKTTKLSEVKVLDGFIMLKSATVTEGQMTKLAAIEIDSDNGILLSSLSTSSASGNKYSGSHFSISPSGISIDSDGVLIIDTTNFKLNSGGSVEMTGTVTANSGSIGNWFIDGGLSSTNDISGASIYISPNLGIRITDNFAVDKNGNLTAKGTIQLAQWMFSTTAFTAPDGAATCTLFKNSAGWNIQIDNILFNNTINVSPNVNNATLGNGFKALIESAIGAAFTVDASGYATSFSYGTTTINFTNAAAPTGVGTDGSGHIYAVVNNSSVGTTSTLVLSQNGTTVNAYLDDSNHFITSLPITSSSSTPTFSGTSAGGVFTVTVDGTDYNFTLQKNTEGTAVTIRKSGETFDYAWCPIA